MRSRRSRLWLLLPLLAAAARCGDDDPAPAAQVTPPACSVDFKGSPLSMRAGRLIDASCRVVTLRGVNARVEGVFDVTFDDGRVPLETVPPFAAEDVTQMRDWGFDSLRLPINWSGIEPTKDGGFDEKYLDRVRQVLDLAQAGGLLVLVDFHQDAYGKDIGEDGAPLWAIEPPPAALLQGPLTDLADRRLSAQTKAAFATFWGDSGAALRSRFSAMAAHVAARFKDHPAVLGFELFNEPVFASDPQLLRLHQEVFAAVRAAAPAKLVFFEPPAERNFLDSIGPGPGPLGPGTVYSPHIYKFAFTALPGNATKDSVAKQNLSTVAEAASWQAGLAFTEWGYNPNGNRSDEYLTWQSELQEEAQASSFFWLWKEDSQGSWGCFDRDGSSWKERPALKKIMARVRPAAVAGTPKVYSFDRLTGSFSLTFTADPAAAAPSLIAVAPALGAPTISCDGAPVSASPDAAGLWPVACGGGTSSEHTISVKVAP